MAESGGRDEVGTIEEGDIYFLYRPKVHEAHQDDPERDEREDRAGGIGDVERFYIVLKPNGARHYRMIVIGRKRLPDVDEHERNWGFVEAISSSPKELEEGLRRETYETETRGERVRPAARPAGEGVYGIVLRRNAMHLVYALELPEKPGPVQRDLNILPEASFALSVKNPEKGSPPNVGLREEDEAHYPKRLQEEFRDRRFGREDPRLLDYEGAEIVLVGARKNPEKAYGVSLDPEEETIDTADIVKKLRFAKSRHPTAPLEQGKWE